MILFLGCSLTWGQSLVCEKWIEEGKSVDFINLHQPPYFNQEELSFEDDNYRKSNIYPYLVSKYFERPYLDTLSNGGSNEDNIFFLENINKLIYTPSIELVIFQFTEFMRDSMLHTVDDVDYPIIDSILLSQIHKINYICSNKLNEGKGAPWIGLSWRPEISSLIDTHYPNNFVSIHDESGKKYNCMSTLMDSHWKYKLNTKYENKIRDSHPSSEFHKVIFESIKNHIENKKIKFTEYQKSNI